ncbi:MAG: hypothetical protein WC807_05955 [Hyphomicrobium sp.]|jgi:hypothetical protein
MPSISKIALAVALVGTCAAVAGPAIAGCKRMGFTVNDYGKDGPTDDAKNLLDKHISQWAADQGIEKFTVGKKDVSCELFLNLIVVDEHTCTASATVCWGNDKAPAGEQEAKDVTKPKSVKSEQAKAEKTEKSDKKDTAESEKPDKKSAAAKSDEAKSDDVKSGEAKTASKPVDAKPSADKKPVEEKKAAEAKPAEHKFVEEKSEAKVEVKAEPKSEAKTEVEAKAELEKNAAEAAKADLKVETGTIPSKSGQASAPAVAEPQVNADKDLERGKAATEAAEAAAASAERAAAAAERAAAAAERAAAALHTASSNPTGPTATAATSTSTTTTTASGPAATEGAVVPPLKPSP